MIRVGFVGLGHHAVGHIEAHRRVGLSEVVAVSRDEADVHPAFAPIEAERVQGHAYDAEIEDWLCAIRDDRPPRCDFFDGANSTGATLVACEAIAQRKTLPVKAYLH